MKIEAPNGDVPEEHREAYGEMCDQFRRIVLQAFSDASHTTIMRDLPPELQMNALIVGSSVGALVPLLMMTKRSSDMDVALLLARNITKIVTEARKFADYAAKGRHDP